MTSLGKLRAPSPGLGCMGMSQGYGTADDNESLATLHRALELGVTFWDTAQSYRGGHNERLLAKALTGHRDEVTLATKFGIVRDENGVRLDARPERVRGYCEESLARLGTDHIDLYYLHRVDPQVPIEETVGAMGELVSAGKVRYLGLSEAAPATIRRAHATHPITALQTEYSLWSRDLEREILPTVRELGIGFVAYSPIGRGFLGGGFTDPGELPPEDVRRKHPRFLGENLRANAAVAARLRDIAAAHDCTPAQLAIAWVMAQGEDIVPIPGTGQLSHLEQNMAAADLELTEAGVRELGEAFPPGVASGDRFADMSLLDR
jgi:aryl-alcohol dehydrogenase-like predicted oxidoreductase